MQIHFVNNYGIGDIRISTGFVADLVKQFPDAHYYHRHGDYILSDIDVVSKSIVYLPPHVMDGLGLLHDKADSYNHPNARKIFYYDQSNDAMYFNTWPEAAQSTDYNYTVSNFEAVIEIFKVIYTELIMVMNNDDSKYLPVDVDDQCSNLINAVLMWMVGSPMVLVCNEECLSGQSYGFNFKQLYAVADMFPKVHFLFTNGNDRDCCRSNITFLEQAFGKESLANIITISRKCELIVGRCSGVYASTQTRANIAGSLGSGTCVTDFIAMTRYLELPFFYRDQVVTSVCSPDPSAFLSAIYSWLWNNP